jgi:hypothetical protein
MADYSADFISGKSSEGRFSDLPDGLFGCPAPFAKIFCFSEFNKCAIFYPSCPTREGRFAIVTNVGKGMRWTRAASRRLRSHADWQNRVVLTPQMLVSSRRNFPFGDGGKSAWLTGESATYAVNHCAGNAG